MWIVSSYARQFLMRMKKPECDQIKNLPPAVAIEQRVVVPSRSTVGTSSEIDDYLRVLMARVASSTRLSVANGQAAHRCRRCRGGTPDPDR